MSPTDRLPVKRTAKLFIGGKFPRSESGRSYEVLAHDGRPLGYASQASRKDLRDAVVTARTAQPGWAGMTAYNRGQILYRVAELMEGRDGAFVVEDSEHVYDTTMASLTTLARYVPRNGYFVVEDGAVDLDERRVDDDWPRGVLPALQDWLQTPEGRAFRVRRDLELYGLSAHPSGFLQRTAP